MIEEIKAAIEQMSQIGTARPNVIYASKDVLDRIGVMPELREEVEPGVFRVVIPSERR